MPRRRAASTIGPATYPPAPRTTSGRRFARIRAHASRAPPGREHAEPEAQPPGKPGDRERVELEARLRNQLRLDASADPANVTVTPLARSASATASAGLT